MKTKLTEQELAAIHGAIDVADSADKSYNAGSDILLIRTYLPVLNDIRRILDRPVRVEEVM